MNAIEPDDPAIAGLTVAAWLDRQPDDADVKAAFRSMIEGLWCQPIGPHAAVVPDRQRPPHHQRGLASCSISWPRPCIRWPSDLAAISATGCGSATPVRTHRAWPGRRPRRSPDGRRIEAGAVLVAVPPVDGVDASRYRAGAAAAAGAALGAWQSGSGDQGAGALRHAPSGATAGLSGMVMWRDPHGLFACDASATTVTRRWSSSSAGRWRCDGDGLGEAGLRDDGRRPGWPPRSGPEAGDIHRPSRCATGPTTVERRRLQRSRRRHRRATTPKHVLRAGAPPLQFASSELSPSFPGYIEGAIVAGRIAAAKVPLGASVGAIATSASGS